MPPFDCRRPKSFKCRADFERRYSSGKEAGTCWELRFSGEKQCPTFRKGGEYLHITSGTTRRLWQQVWGHSRSQMVWWMRRSGLHLTSSRLMHHTYEVMEARGWIQRELNLQCKVPALCYSYSRSAQKQQECAHSHAVWWMIVFVLDYD